MDISGLKVVAFDCDGVLFDSSIANRTYYNTILAQFGLPEMSEDQFAYAHMHTVDETLAHLIQDPQTLAAANQYRRRLSYVPFIRHMVEEPYLRDLLAKLKPSYNTAIATNRTDTMDRVLIEHRLEGNFDLIVTAQDVRYPKPHPESLQAVLTYFNVHPDEVVYIGDSELDAVASQRAGIPFIAFANPDLTAAAHVDNLQQVARILGL